MSNFFDDVKDDVQESGDRIGGFSRLETDVYEGNIKMAYAGTSKGGSKFVHLTLDINGAEHTFIEYVTSAKTGDNTYKKADGTSHALQGYSTINDLCMVTTNKPLNKQDIQVKKVKVYNPEVQKEEPTDVPVLMELLGKPVKVAITLIRENKRKLEGKTYVDTAEAQEKNEISKFFHATKNITLTEAREKITEPTFLPKWLERNKGVTRDNYKEVKGGAQSGSPRGKANSSDDSEDAEDLFS